MTDLLNRLLAWVIFHSRIARRLLACSGARHLRRRRNEWVRRRNQQRAQVDQWRQRLEARLQRARRDQIARVASYYSTEAPPWMRN